MTNKELIERYPFLIPRNVWTDEIVIDLDAEEIEYTLLDDMMPGWRKAFGEQMCEEIRNILIQYNYLNEYRITEIKEKFGMLRWYDNGSPKEVIDIINKYEGISAKTCILCGQPATQISKGWISPYCNCVNNHKYYEKEGYIPIDEWFNEENKQDE